MTHEEATGNIIDFLNRYELDFGGDPVDLEIMTDAEALRDHIAHLLVQPPIWISAEYADVLRSSLIQADWLTVVAEQRQRVLAADTLQAGVSTTVQIQFNPLSKHEAETGSAPYS